MPEPAIIDTTVPIDEVTLLEDRAVIRRRASLSIPPGRSRLRIERVAPVLVDKTITAELSQGEARVRVRDVRVERERVTEDAQRTGEHGRAHERLRAAQARRVALEQSRDTAGEAHQGLLRVAEQTVHDLGEDVAYGRAEPNTWASTMDDLDARLSDAATRVVELDHELSLLDREIDDLRARLAEVANISSVARAHLVLELHSEHTAPIERELVLDYMVPGAVWRPWHEARLSRTDDAVTVRTDGCVWQATGEDWVDVSLRFSTERPSLGSSPPKLRDDVLRATRRSATVEVQTREQEVETTSVATNTGVVKATAPDLPGIDDGGDAMLLVSRGRGTVPSNGRAHRIPIGEFEAPSTPTLVCTPELEAAVLLRTEQTHRGSMPLLAGPIDLIRRGGLVGRTSVLFVAVGERFELGWGPQPELRVHREVEMLEFTRRSLSAWTRKPRRVTVKLSNLDAAPVDIEVRERVAVSEIEKVSVEVIEAAPRAKPDADGFVAWDVHLPGWSHETLSLEWALIVHDDVVGV